MNYEAVYRTAPATPGLLKTLYVGFNELNVSTLDNKKGFINLHFLQKMNCQKTEWDQARLSSLV